jgi:hypothetical protein
MRLPLRCINKGLVRHLYQFLYVLILAKALKIGY